MAPGCRKPKTEFILATTTSVQDSGLLDVLLPAFTKAKGFVPQVVAVGSGQAIAMARQGDADAVLAHSPQAEQEVEQAGFVVERRKLMSNAFVIVGPPADPAGIRGRSVAHALQALTQGKASFVSRGDNSGTHVKENQLWASATLTPAGNWYLKAGQGMGATLAMASELKAYTLTDQATFAVRGGPLQLEVLVKDDAALDNPYSIMIVNPKVHKHVNAAAARALAAFLLSAEGQKLIGEYGVDKYGRALFTPVK
ncbi:MAG: substrate-binding domain-containing protein [Bacillota bacterium]